MTRPSSICVRRCCAQGMRRRRWMRAACCAACSPCLRHAFPTARFLVRLDGGFATPEILDVLDAESRLDDVVAMGRNAVLTRLAAPTMVEARARSEVSGQTEHLYTEAAYAARTCAA